MDAEEEFILQKLMEGFERPSPRRTSGRGDRSRSQPRPLASPTRAVRELLDEYEELFFHEGATLNYVESVAGPWRQAGIRPPEVRDWLDAGVYSDESDLAVALATAGFEPRQAARIKARYGGNSEPMSVISWVRGSSDQAAMARRLMDRVVAVREQAQGEAG